MTNPEDTLDLNDADWAAINKLKRAATGDDKAWDAALKELIEENPIRAYRVICAYLPNEIRETTRDAIAKAGIAEEEFRDLVRKLDPPPTKQ